MEELLRTPQGFRGDPHVDEAKCVGCVACAHVCPADAIEIVGNGAIRRVRFMHKDCIFCGSCQDVCPSEAVELRAGRKAWFPPRTPPTRSAPAVVTAASAGPIYSGGAGGVGAAADWTRSLHWARPSGHGETQSGICMHCRRTSIAEVREAKRALASLARGSSGVGQGEVWAGPAHCRTEPGAAALAAPPPSRPTRSDPRTRTSASSSNPRRPTASCGARPWISAPTSSSSPPARAAGLRVLQREAHRAQPRELHLRPLLRRDHADARPHPRGDEGRDRRYRFTPAWIDDYIPQPATGQLGREIMDRIRTTRGRWTRLSRSRGGEHGAHLSAPGRHRSTVTNGEIAAALVAEGSAWLSPPLELRGHGNLSRVVSVTGGAVSDWEVSWGRRSSGMAASRRRGATFSGSQLGRRVARRDRGARGPALARAPPRTERSG